MNALTKLRRVTGRLRATREQQDQLVREATAEGASRREVASAAKLSVGQVQRIVKETE